MARCPTKDVLIGVEVETPVLGPGGVVNGSLIITRMASVHGTSTIGPVNKVCTGATFASCSVKTVSKLPGAIGPVLNRKLGEAEGVIVRAMIDGRFVPNAVSLESFDGGRLVESKFYATGGARESSVSGANVGKPAVLIDAVAIDAVEEVSFAGWGRVRVIDGSPCATYRR
jgi:hypothetical protein